MSRMRSSLGWRLLLVLCIGGILSAALLVLSQREPSHKGKRLSEWAAQFGTNNWAGGEASRAAANEAQVAIRQIDTNGIPFLLDLIQTTDTGIKKNARRVVPIRWHKTLRLTDHSQTSRRTGAHGIVALGTNAATALPKLIDLAKHHPDPDVRYVAFFAIRGLGPAAEPAIPFYIESLKHPVEMIADEAALALGYMQLQHDIVVPALTNYLERSRNATGTYVCQDAIEALGQFGTNAKVAGPLLITFTNHPLSIVRLYVTNWLPRIDPENAKKGGIPTN